MGDRRRDAARPGGDHRRWGGRHLDRVSPRRARLARHRARRSGGADERLDVPFRRPRWPAAQLGHPDPDDDVRRRPLPPACGGDRGGSIVARGRIAPAGVQPGAPRGAAPAGGLGQDVRASPRAHRSRGREGAVSADVDRWRARCGPPPHRRLARPERSRGGARRRGPQARRHDPPAHEGRRHRHRTRPGHGRDGRASRRAGGDRGRGRRQRRRHVRPGDRADGRRDRAPDPDRPPVPVHRGDRRRPSRPAPAARPGQPRVFPRGGRRAVHGWLRARSRAVGARWDPAGLQRQAPRAGHAALRIDHGRRDPARSRDGGGAGQPRDQRTRGVHPGQRVHPR